jgi:MFS family permease
MVLEFIYDGTLFSLNRIGLNLYTNQMVIGAAEMLASLYANIVVTRFKRKRYTIINLVLIAVLLAVFILTGGKTDDDGEQTSGMAWLELTVLILMRFTLSSLWGFYFVYLSELYPCEITSISYGYMSAVGAAAASASPYIRLATKDSSMLLMAGLALVAAGHVGCLPETKGTPTKLRVK